MSLPKNGVTVHFMLSVPDFGGGGQQLLPKRYAAQRFNAGLMQADSDIDRPGPALNLAYHRIKPTTGGCPAQQIAYPADRLLEEKFENRLLEPTNL